MKSPRDLDNLVFGLSRLLIWTHWNYYTGNRKVPPWDGSKNGPARLTGLIWRGKTFKTFKLKDVFNNKLTIYNLLSKEINIINYSRKKSYSALKRAAFSFFFHKRTYNVLLLMHKHFRHKPLLSLFIDINSLIFSLFNTRNTMLQKILLWASV